VKIDLNKQRINAIRRAPAGVLPSFLNGPIENKGRGMMQFGVSTPAGKKPRRQIKLAPGMKLGKARTS
jgi:hypothetical protein